MRAEAGGSGGEVVPGPGPTGWVAAVDDRLAGPPAGPDVAALIAERVDSARWRPVLRPDVERVELPTRVGHPEHYLAAPEGAVLGLRPSEVAVVDRLDGTTTVAELALGTLGAGVEAQLAEGGEDDAREADGGGLGTAAVLDLLGSLQAAGHLEGPSVEVDAAVRRAVRRGWWRGGGWRSRRRRGGVDPPSLTTQPSVEWRGADRWVRAVHDRLTHLMFTPVGVVVASLVAVAGLAATIAILFDDERGLPTAVPARELALVLALDLVIVVVHEYGHAAALVHHRRRVRGAGVALHYGSPAFYIDSSDSLMIERRPRIVVSLAGPWFEATITGAVALVLFAFPDMVGSDIVYRFLVLNAFALFLNLLPFLELDGYWILSDWLRIPDLRARSLEFLRRGLWRKVRSRQFPTSAEWALMAYGLVAAVAAVAAIGASAFFWDRLFGDLVRQLWHAGPLGLLGLVLLVLVVANPLVRLVVRMLAAGRDELRDGWRRRRFRRERPWRVEAARMLDETGLFGDIPVEDLSALAGRVELHRVTAGTDLVVQGERADAYWLIRSGRTEVLDTGAEPPRLVRHLGPGDGFGELSLLTGTPRTATVRASTAVEAFRIDRGTFARLLAARAEVPAYQHTVEELRELRSLPPFAGAGAEELLELLDHGAWCHAEPGADLVTQGEAGDSWYVVASGRLVVIEDGVEVRQLGSGAGFGERALLGDGRRTATVRAVTPARLFELDRAGFEALVAGSLAEAPTAGPPRIDTARAH